MSFDKGKVYFRGCRRNADERLWKGLRKEGGGVGWEVTKGERGGKYGDVISLLI